MNPVGFILGLVPQKVKDFFTANIIAILLAVSVLTGTAAVVQTVRIAGFHVHGPFGLTLGFDGYAKKLEDCQSEKAEFKSALDEEAQKRATEHEQNTNSYVGLQKACKDQIVHVRGADRVIREIEYAPLPPPSDDNPAPIGADRLRSIFGQSPPGDDPSAVMPAGGNSAGGPGAASPEQRLYPGSANGSGEVGHG